MTDDSDTTSDLAEVEARLQQRLAAAHFRRATRRIGDVAVVFGPADPDAAQRQTGSEQ